MAHWINPIGIASWGVDRTRCDAMKSIGNQIFA